VKVEHEEKRGKDMINQWSTRKELERVYEEMKKILAAPLPKDTMLTKKQQKAWYTRNLDGKRFIMVRGNVTKATAEAITERYKRMGFLARVIDHPRYGTCAFAWRKG
jgi:hypothetical protein